MRIRFIQDIINNLRNKDLFENLDKILDRKIALDKGIDFDTLILGQSCMYYGWRPNKNEFNMAIGGQDLYTSCCLYKVLNSPRIKNVVMSYSLYNRGFNVIRTSMRNACVINKVLFGIDYIDQECAKEYNLYSLEPVLEKIIKKKTNFLRLILNKGYRGEQRVYKKHKLDMKNVETTALSNLKNNQREQTQTKYCEELLELTKQNNQNIYFVIAPRRKEYRDFLPPKSVLFKDLYDLCSKYEHCKLFDYYDSEEFSSKDYCDIYHLNKKASVRFTELIRTQMQGS